MAVSSVNINNNSNFAEIFSPWTKNMVNESNIIALVDAL
jgi:hypothetical protein